MSENIATSSLTKVKEVLTKFLYGNYYLATITAITLLFWIAKLEVVGFSVFVVIACYIFLTQKDMSPVLPLVFGIMFVPRGLSAFSNSLFYLVFVPAVICLVYHFIRYPIKKIKLGGMFFPLLFLCVAYFLGGILSVEISEYGLGLSTILGVGVAMFGSYFILKQYVCPPDNVDVRKYFFYIIIFACLIPCIEACYIKYYLGKRASWDTLGWGHSNVIGYMTLVAVPACYYFMAKAKYVLPYFIALLFFFFATYSVGCDGALGIMGIMYPIITIFTYKMVAPRKRKFYFYYFFITTLACLIVGIIYIYLKEISIFNFISTHILDDTGRTTLYKKALERFEKYPLFGNGVYYPHLTIDRTMSWNYAYGFVEHYHSIIFNTLATMGIVGMSAYVIVYISRFKILTKRAESFNFYMFFSVLFFVSYCFVDCAESSVFVIIINIAILLTEYVNDLPKETRYKICFKK